MSYALLGVTFIREIFFAPLYLRHLGSSLYGAWLASNSILTLLGLADLGVNSIVVQKVATAYGATEYTKASRYAWNALIIAMLLACLPAIVGFVISGYLPVFVSIAVGEQPRFRIAFLIGTLATSLTVVMYCFGGILIALQRQLIHGAIQVVGELLAIAFTIAMLARGFGLYALAVGMLSRPAFAVVAEGLVFLLIANRDTAMRNGGFHRETIVELIRPSLGLFAGRVGASVVQGSDNLLIGSILGPSSVVVYVLSRRALDSVCMLVGHLVGAITPSLAHFFGESGSAVSANRSLVKTLIHYVIAIAFIAMGGFVVFDRSFVGLWVGASNFVGQGVVCVLGVYGILYLISLCMGNFIFAKGHLLVSSFASGAEALVRVILVVALGHWFGLLGVAVAGLIACAVTSSWICLFFFRRTFELVRSDAIGSGISLLRILAGVFIAAALSSLSEARSAFGFGLRVFVYLALVTGWTLAVDRPIRSTFLGFFLKGRLIIPRASE